MLFRQLFDPESSTYTYLIADERTGAAALVDPVRERVERDVQLLAELGLSLRYVLETHVHADHVTAAGLLRARCGAQTVVSRRGGAACADVPVDQGDRLMLGDVVVEVRATPGHTHGDVTYVVPALRAAFTGDALLIRGCGRTDFQQGDARTLYRSVHEQLFSLPDDYLVYPGHDYQGRTASTIGEEKRCNPRLAGKTEDEFVAIMDALALPKPKRIDEAVPANLRCGRASILDGAVTEAPDGVPEVDPAFVHRHAGDLRVVDVREPAELYGELGRLSGVENVPLADVATAAARWSPAEDVVLVCRSGARSARAAHLLMERGFTRVASMRGGMIDWRARGLPCS